MRHIRNPESHAAVAQRIVDIFSRLSYGDPAWLIGVYEVDEEDGETEADLILRVDVGDFPVLLCTTDSELQELVRDPYSSDCLFLLIYPDYPDDRIKDKSLQFFGRERRIRRNFVTYRPLTARR